MKFYTSFMLFIFILSTPIRQTYATDQQDPLLVIVIMVKDEAPFMVSTLQPFVDVGITSYIVLDTGSTDDTIGVTERFFEEHTITQGYIFQESFVDFATSRNRALEIAEEQFPHAAFFLMPDAEWYCKNVEDLVEFCQQEISKTNNDTAHSYLIKLSSDTIDFYQQRLLRNGNKLRFAGVVHETISIGTHYQVPNDIYFKLGVSRQGLEKTKGRWKRDKELLLNEHTKNPDNPRTVFYLAQTCFCLGDLENAYKYYTLRTTLKGFDQEVAESYFKLGEVTLSLMKKGNPDYKWEMALSYFLESYDLRPWRIEPLVEIGNSYIEQNKQALAFLFLRRTVELPYPDRDILFVDNLSYHYKRYDLLGRCAWYNDEFELGEWAVKKALAYAPHMPHLHQNLKCYLDRKESTKVY